MGLSQRIEGENTYIGQTNMQFQRLEFRGDKMTEEQRKDAMMALGRIVLSIEGLKMDYKQDVQTIIYALQSPHPDDQELINTKSNLEHSMAFARDLSRQIDAMKQELAQTKLELARSRKQQRRDFLTDKKVVISKMEIVQTIPKITPMK